MTDEKSLSQVERDAILSHILKTVSYLFLFFVQLLFNLSYIMPIDDGKCSLHLKLSGILLETTIK